jgi:hypothetical protein
MKRKIKCKDVLDKVCKLEDVFDLEKLEINYQNHIKFCDRCSSYLMSLHTVVGLYKQYNAILSPSESKKIFKEVCCKLKSMK